MRFNLFKPTPDGDTLPRVITSPPMKHVGTESDSVWRQGRWGIVVHRPLHLSFSSEDFDQLDDDDQASVFLKVDPPRHKPPWVIALMSNATLRLPKCFWNRKINGCDGCYDRSTIKRRRGIVSGIKWRKVSPWHGKKSSLCSVQHPVKVLNRRITAQDGARQVAIMTRRRSPVVLTTLLNTC